MCLFTKLQNGRIQLYVFIVKTSDTGQNVPGGNQSASASSENFSVQVFPETLPSLSDRPTRVPPNPPCPSPKELALFFILSDSYQFSGIHLYPNTSQGCFDLCFWIHIFFLILVPLGLSFIGTQF